MSQKEKREVTFSNRTVIRVMVVIFLTLLAIRFLGKVTHVLELVFVAFFLSLALNPAVSWISQQLRLKSRAVATGIAYVVVVILLGIFSVLVFPPLVRETVDFVQQTPSIISNVNNEQSTAGKFVKKYHLQDTIDGLSSNIRDRTQNIQQPVIATATRVGGALVAIITVLVLTFMMLVEGPLWVKKYWEMHPVGRREHDELIAKRMYRVVTGYVNGQVLIAAIASMFSLIALIIASNVFNVSVNPVALAGIVFIFGLIPLIGNTLAAAIVILVCLFSSLGLAVTMLVYFLLYQQIENATLYPYIQAKHNELTPLLVFSAALLGAGVGGLLGAFVAIPLAGCLKILFVDYLEDRGIKKT